MSGVAPYKEHLWRYVCPFCEKGTITGLRIDGYQKSKHSEKETIFEYKGNCCAYYPKENPVVDAAISKAKAKKRGLL